MATFKVGQRVRIVGHETQDGREFIGREATIERLAHTPLFFEGTWWALKVNGRRALVYFAEYHLAPLTDPGADAFLARLKKLGSEPVNDAPKVEVTR